MGVEAMVNLRSRNERASLGNVPGRRLESRKLLKRTPVRPSVMAMEKKAIAAVSIKRGSAKRRRCAIKPGRCQAGAGMEAG